VSMLDEIRDNPAARSLVSARHVAARLTSHGWHVREGAVHSAGVADAVAGRSWRRGELAARVQLVVRCHAGGELLFSQTERAAEDILASYCAGDDLPEQRRGLALLLDSRDLDSAPIMAALHRAAYPSDEAAAAAARIDAPPAKVHATAFREPRAGFEPFAAVAAEAFASLDAIRNDLFARDCEVLDDDLDTLDTDAACQAHAGHALAELANTCELLHALVVTDAQLSVLSGGNRVNPAIAVRLRRQHVVTAEQTWIDIVQTEAFDAYAETVSEYYERAFAKRRFKP
jgi:hypothetical protein